MLGPRRYATDVASELVDGLRDGTISLSDGTISLSEGYPLDPLLLGPPMQRIITIRLRYFTLEVNSTRILPTLLSIAAILLGLIALVELLSAGLSWSFGILTGCSAAAGLAVGIITARNRRARVGWLAFHKSER